MKISIATAFPNLYDAFLQTSLMGRAQENKLVTFNVANFFDYTSPKVRIDAPSYGPGAGMVLKPELVAKTIDDQDAKLGKSYKIFLSPKGKRLTQRMVPRLAKTFADHDHVMLVTSRYEGMDDRVEQHYADETISLGDFVAMGGDVPAMLLLEVVLRFVPGVVGKQESIERESFAGPFVDYPEYTEPLTWQGMSVPEIVRSGNHAAIEQWRQEQAARQTVRHHFEWLRSTPLTDKERSLTQKVIPPHYVALMHEQVLVKDNATGTTSVTSLDIHDIARSATTYGIEQYAVVTPLVDQQKIVQTLLDFWQQGEGAQYNPSRYEAVKRVVLKDSLDAFVADIEQREGKKPFIIATSARPVEHQRVIDFESQGSIWCHDRPVLILFGTGYGLDPSLLDRCDAVLVPVVGLTEFNHLSVRSAAAIVLDRWLGLKPIAQQ